MKMEHETFTTKALYIHIRINCSSRTRNKKKKQKKKKHTVAQRVRCIVTTNNGSANRNVERLCLVRFKFYKRRIKTLQMLQK